MKNLNEAALICDLAETYRVYDLRQLPLRTVAALSAGLRENARIFKSYKEENNLTTNAPDLSLQIQAIIADRLGTLLTVYGAKVTESIYERLMGAEPEKKGKQDARAFSSVEEFNRVRYGGEADV